jgi:RNA polymerase sigma-70 factor (ECF subfamily)
MYFSHCTVTYPAQSPAHLVFWLRKVTGHRCIDVSRRHRAEVEQLNDDMPEPASPFREPDPLLSATLRRLVATLPEGPRMVLTLRYQEDLEPSEIAAILEMPVNTVKSHLRRSLQVLRGKVTRYLGEEVEV